MAPGDGGGPLGALDIPSLLPCPAPSASLSRCPGVIAALRACTPVPQAEVPASSVLALGIWGHARPSPLRPGLLLLVMSTCSAVFLLAGCLSVVWGMLEVTGLF